MSNGLHFRMHMSTEASRWLAQRNQSSQQLSVNCRMRLIK